MSKHNIDQTNERLHDFRLTMKEIVKSKHGQFGNNESTIQDSSSNLDFSKIEPIVTNATQLDDISEAHSPIMVRNSTSPGHKRLKTDLTPYSNKLSNTGRDLFLMTEL